MAINQLTTANTFQQWLGASQSLITTTNNLTDGGNSATFYANTNVTVGGNLNVTQLTGSANTAIYANIANAATASTGDSLAFAIALG
tara:strand:- start:1125 stop:1385 length:261 start_codon:yes stop_codon:yes gene_type:complete